MGNAALVILTLGMWLLGGTGLKVAAQIGEAGKAEIRAEPSSIGGETSSLPLPPQPPLLKVRSSPSPTSIKPLTSATPLKNLEPASDPTPNPLNLLLTQTEGSDPGRRLPQPPTPEPPPNFNPPPVSPQPTAPALVLENLQTDFTLENDVFNPGQHRQLIQQTAQFRLKNSDRLRFITGWNTFSQPKIQSVSNIPLQLEWERNLGRATLQLGVGTDTFDRLPSTLNFSARIDTGIIPRVGLSAIIEQQPLKPNAETIGNQISAWRFGPNLYWQIDNNTSFFGFFRWGNYSDGNSEQTSFSRLEHKIGQFSLAANLFTSSYKQDPKNGYFAPPDFLIYNGEVGWEGDLTNFLRCRVATSLGQQRLEGKISTDNGYQTRCKVRLSPTVEADLGYNFTGQSLTGQLRARF